MLSELRRERRAAGVARWFAQVEDEELFLSVLVVGEIRQGIERLRSRDGTQAAVFERWLETLRAAFAHRILPVTDEIADAWGRLSADRPLPVVDALLGATALVHDLVLVTRDSALAATEVPLLDPWRARADR